MKELNTFQKALLEANSAQFDRVPGEEYIDFTPSIKFETKACRPVRRRNGVLRYGLIAAAIAILLTGSIFAAVRFSVGGQVEKSIYSIPEYDVENQKYLISFQEKIAAPDAPDEIKEFRMPTSYVSKDRLNLNSCFWEDEDNTWYPHNEDMEHSMPLDGKVQTVHTEWRIGEHFVMLTQKTAKSIQPGKGIFAIHFDASSPIKVSHKTFTLGEYEIFCFNMDYSAFEEYAEQDNAVDSFWYWTDGHYLYALSLPADLSQEERVELFHSFAPVEDIYDYLSIEE